MHNWEGQRIEEEKPYFCKQYKFQFSNINLKLHFFLSLSETKEKLEKSVNEQKLLD